MDHTHALQTLDAQLQAMPALATMQIRIDGYDGESLRLHAPLSPHTNDKGSAFGGSLTSLMTLTGWGLVMLHLQRHGISADVFVADSELRYRAPLYADLHATARLADGADWDAFLMSVGERGRGRIALTAEVALPEGGNAAVMNARYVAVVRR